MTAATSSAAAVDPAHDPGGERCAIWLLGGLLLYFSLQMVMRLFTSQSAELDEAEQLLWTQDLRWGYGPQPPLYSWLQWVLFEVFGVSILALALL